MIAIVLVIEIVCVAVAILLSFVFLRPFMRENSVSTGRAITDQVSSYANTFYDTIMNSTTQILISDEFNNLLLHSMEPSLTEEVSHTFNLYLNRMASSYKGTNIRGFLLLTPKGEVFTSIADITAADLALLDDPWFSQQHFTPHVRKLSALYQSDTDYGKDTVCGAYYALVQVKGEHFKFITLYNATNLLYNMEKISNNFFDLYLISDINDNVFYFYGQDSDHFYLLDHLADLSSSAEQNLPQGVLFNQRFSSTTLSFISFISNPRLDAQYTSMFILTMSLSVFICVLTVLLLTPMLSKRIAPLRQLRNTMAQVSGGNMDVISDIKTGDEIEFISDTFNEMLRNMKLWTTSLIEKEKKESYMNYLLLVSQIDPHFIYNAMSIINRLAAQKSCDEIITVNTALLKFLKNRINVADTNAFDTVENEIDALRQYITIMKHSLKQQIDVQIKVDQRALLLSIPKNIIQPIVENSYKHGLYTPEGDTVLSRMCISVDIIGSDILISVEDNGVGIDQATIHKLNSEQLFSLSNNDLHVGIYNLQTRINYLYGERNCMHFDSTPSQFTRVTIKLPIETTTVAPKSETGID